MNVEKVFKSKRKNEIKQLYEAAFPKTERMPFPLMLIMSCLWHTEFLAYYDEDVLCGFAYMASLRKQTFIMFLAVDEKQRSKGYGSQILKEIQERAAANKVLVSIEPCDELAVNRVQREKRKQFYLRNGYAETGYMMKLSGQIQEILIQSGEFNKRQFILFFMLYSCGTVIPKIWQK